MSLRAKLIVGLADEAAGDRLYSAIQSITGTSDASALTVAASGVAITGTTVTVSPATSVTISPPTVTVGASTVSVGVAAGRISFYGAAVTTKQTGITLNNVTSIAAALVNLGLIATTTP